MTEQRHLDAYFYNVGYIEGRDFANHQEMIAFLKENKFKVSPFERVYPSMEALFADLDQVERDRDKLDFLIDGMVIKIDDFASREEAGYTQKFPRWAVAYKFEAEEVTTVVEDVLWDVGRTGKLTPTAVLEGVEIGGATVRRATLNNYEDILRKKVRLGCRVFVRRSNDVIPEILGAVEGQGGSAHGAQAGGMSGLRRPIGTHRAEPVLPQHPFLQAPAGGAAGAFCLPGCHEPGISLGKDGGAAVSGASHCGCGRAV